MKTRFTDEQIIQMIKEQEAGEKTADVCRRYPNRVNLPHELVCHLITAKTVQLEFTVMLSVVRSFGPVGSLS